MTISNKKQALGVFFLGCGSLVFILLAFAGVYLFAGWKGYKESPMLVDVLDNDPQILDQYKPTPAQQEYLSTFGDPEGFTILFYEEEVPGGGINTVRLETWEYYSLNIGLTFINGALIAEDPIEIEHSGRLDPMPYRPDQFSAFMSLDEIISATGIENFVEIPLDNNYLDGGVSYFANSLTFGLKNNELLFVEALAISSE